MGTLPTWFSLPGKQVQPLVPSRRMVIWGSWVQMAIVASWVICEGPEASARLILHERASSSSFKISLG